MNRKGFTLIEMIAATVIGGIAVFGAYNFIAYVNHSTLLEVEHEQIRAQLNTTLAGIQIAFTNRLSDAFVTPVSSYSVWISSFGTAAFSAYTPPACGPGVTSALSTCGDLVIYQNPNGAYIPPPPQTLVYPVTLIRNQFDTSCDTEPGAATTGGPLMPTTICKAGTVPQVWWSQYQDVYTAANKFTSTTVFSRLVYPNSLGYGATLCFQVSKGCTSGLLSIVANASVQFATKPNSALKIGLPKYDVIRGQIILSPADRPADIVEVPLPSPTPPAAPH